MKYYVQSGDLKIIIQGDHPFEAVRDAIGKKKDEFYLYTNEDSPMQIKMASAILVSERGFVDKDVSTDEPYKPREGEYLLSTDKIMQALGFSSGPNYNEQNSDDS